MSEHIKLAAQENFHSQYCIAWFVVLPQSKCVVLTFFWLVHFPKKGHPLVKSHKVLISYANIKGLNPTVKKINNFS